MNEHKEFAPKYFESGCLEKGHRNHFERTGERCTCPKYLREDVAHARYAGSGEAKLPLSFVKSIATTAHGQLEQLTADFVEEMDKLSNRNYQLRMENEELKSRLQGDPAAARFDFDGDGYQYIDSGSGSDWMTRKPGAELLYLQPPAQPQVPEGYALVPIEPTTSMLFYASTINRPHDLCREIYRDMIAGHTHPESVLTASQEQPK